MRITGWLLLVMYLAGAALGQQTAATDPTVSRQEYEQLLRQQEQMRQEIEQLKAKRDANPAGPASRPAALPSATIATQADADDINEQIRTLGDQLHAALPGTEHLLIAGDAAIGFTNTQKTNSTFFAGVSPLILWQPTDRLLFETALNIGLATDPSTGAGTSVDLALADASFVVNDYLLVGGGLFAVPFGQYHNHFDPPWINKLPDDPLVFGSNGLAPVSEVGIFGRGAAPLGGMKLTYDAYISNGPQLITNAAGAGSLNFQDFTDLNNGKAVGGRIGFLPLPRLEMGYSIEYAQTAPTGFGRHVYALLEALDLNWVQDAPRAGGVFTTRAEWIWSNLQRTTYGGGGTGFGPLTFANHRDGGYAELAYRPTYSTNRFIQKLEVVGRYNLLRTPLASPGGNREQFFELGVDYWLTPSAVLKLAYGIDDRKRGPNQNEFAVQFGIGL